MTPFLTQFWSQTKQWRRNNARVILTSGAVSAVVVGLRLLSLLQSLELAALDTLFRLQMPEPIDERVKIVSLSQKEVNEYGWPLSDDLVAELLQKINAHEPSVIGFDILRSRPYGTGFAELRDTIKSLPDFVGIEYLHSDKDYVTPALDVMWKPDSSGQLTQGVGFNNLKLDPDGVVRRNLLYWDFEGRTHSSFTLQLVTRYLWKTKGIVQEAYPPEQPKYLKLGSAVFRDLRDTHSLYGWLDADSNYQFLANMRRPSVIEQVSVADVLNDRIDPDLFKGRIVIIGSAAENTKDFFLTPFGRGFSSLQGRISGVEIHANFTSEMLSAVLDGRPLLRSFAWWQDVVFILTGSIIGSVVIWRWRSPIRGGLVLITCIVGLGGLTYSLFITSGWLFPVVPCLMSLLGSAIVITSYLAHQEKELSRSKEFFHSIIDNIPDPVFVKNENHHLMVVNEAFCQFIDASTENIIGKSDYDLFETQEAEVFRSQERAVLQTGKAQENEESFTSLSGSIYTIATKRSLHKDVAGNLFLVGVIRDITERKKLEADLRRTAEELSRSNSELQESEKRLRHLANHDPLTGLPNRKLFNEKLQQLVEWGEETQQLFSLLFLDLDGFKPVNDTLGHDMGDILLKAVAQRIKNCLRSSDIVCRLGGDEFTVMLPGIKHPLDSTIVADKILATVAAPYMLQGNSIQITVSMGISVYPMDSLDPNELIKLADMAMYEAKRSGRNQYQVTNTLKNLTREVSSS